MPQDGNHDGPQLDDCPVAAQIPRLSRPPRIPEQPLESVTDPLVATEGTMISFLKFLSAIFFYLLST